MRLDRSTRSYRWLMAGVGVLGALLLRILGATWRVRWEGPDPFADGQPFVGVIWHRGMLPAGYIWRGRGIAVPVSRSRDGDLISTVLNRLGFPTPRGSSSRGGTEVFRESVRRLETGRVVAVLSDGPRGPARILKPGVIAMAGSTGLPLVPAAVAAAPCLRFGSWDRSLLPYPFARVVCRYGPALQVPKNPSEAEFEGIRARVEAALDALTRQLDAELGLPEETPALAAPETRQP